MPTLILMRHAKAVREHEAASDRARGLTSRGRREAALAAVAMREQGMAPTAAHASSAVRTVETAVIVGGDIAPDVGLTYVDGLYLASAETIWADAMRAASPAQDSVLMVGHNPGMHELVALLIERSGDRSALARSFLADMPTAAWAAFDVEGGDLDSTMARFLAGWAPSRDA
jgi:phosphohistidine phosphatase